MKKLCRDELSSICQKTAKSAKINLARMNLCQNQSRECNLKSKC